MRDFDPIDKLLQTVDKLTVGHTTAVLQDFEDGGRVTTIQVPALIGLLRESFYSSTTGSGGGSLPNQRNVLDGDALEKYDKICDDISAAYRSVTSAHLFSSPETNLRQWFIAFKRNVQAGKVAEEYIFDQLQVWVDWVRVIEDKLFPPTTLEVITPCPVCEQRWAKNGDGDSIPAIVIEYREPSSDRVNALSKSMAKCRSCDTVWRGDRRLRELAFAIDEIQHAETTDFDPVENGKSVTLLGAGNSCAQNIEMGAS